MHSKQKSHRVLHDLMEKHIYISDIFIVQAKYQVYHVIQQIYSEGWQYQNIKLVAPPK